MDALRELEMLDHQRERLDRVLANSQQLNVVIDDLLFFVEIEAGRVAVRPETVDIRDLVNEVVTALAPRSDGAVAFRLETAVGAETCTPECICDVNAAAGVTATDALVCLKKAVGQDVTLDCGSACPVTDM